MHNFKELKVWQKSIDMTVETYKLTENFPNEEKFGLISQMRRAAVSIAANIAEGTGRRTEKDFNAFLGNSLGSSFELETELTISFRLKYITNDIFNGISLIIQEIQKMIVGLQKSLNIN